MDLSFMTRGDRVGPAALLWCIVVAGGLGACGGEQGGDGADELPSSGDDDSGDGTSGAASTGDGDGDGDGDGNGDGDEELCNGLEELCDRTFDEVVFPGTHNAHASFAYGFSAFNANQNETVTTQLMDGMRVLLMDTYYGDEGVVLCHGPCSLGSIPHEMVLEEIVDFMELNPAEVVSIVYQDGVSPEDLAVDFEATGAIDMVFTRDPSVPWPTLGEMIADGTRLLVTAESSGPPPAWHHYVWDHAWDTPYSFDNVEDFSCALNRGSTDNDLFQINHWVGTSLGLPSEDGAMVANTQEELLQRVLECRDMWNRLPNFLVVDFYDHGALAETATLLNLAPPP